MSRYTKQLDDNKELAYGFDHAVGYFYDIFDTAPDLETDEEAHIEGADSMFGYLKAQDKSKLGKGFPNSQMCEVLEKYNVRKDHIQQVALDLPI